MAARTLDARARNRALLARQLLLDRVRLSPIRAIERLVGLQAQTPRSPYTALWSRLRDFDPMSLSRALESRRVVRIALMRSTIHLVSAADALTLRPLMVPVLQRELTNPTFRVPLDGVDPDELAVRARDLLERQPLPPAALGRALLERWPQSTPAALAHAARTLLPLVQVPPRGRWDASGATTLAPADHWLGRPIRSDATWDEVALRYLGAFGPARAADLVAWSRITGLTEVMERLRPRLLVLRDEKGKELFDVPRAPRPPADVIAPPRFLPDYDNVLLAHADRNHVFADAHRAGIQTANGVLPGTVLVDGRVSASWRIERAGQRARLLISPFDDLPRSARAAVVDEGRGLLALLAADAIHPEVVVQ